MPAIVLQTDGLQDYIRGQLEIRGDTEIYRGEIEEIRKYGEGEFADLVVQFKWLAKGQGFPTPPVRWVIESDLLYRIPLSTARVDDVGDGRITILSLEGGMLYRLFLPGDVILDPKKVEGLVLPE